MAALLVDQYEVGIPYIVPPIRSIGDVALLSQGDYEFFPRLGATALANAIENGEVTGGDDFIGTYQSFSMSVEAIPTLPGEVITNHDLSMTHCILEDPLPGADPSRTGAEEGLDIPVSPYWVAPLFIEPTVSILGGVGNVANISGYFSERNFYDREWVLGYDNGIMRFTSEGISYSDDPSILRSFALSALTKTLSSSINVNTFYPVTQIAAQQWGPEIMQSYINAANNVISYKPSEIKKLRFFFAGTITSNEGLFPYTAHTTVQVNQKYAEQRLEFALNRRTFGNLLPI